MLRGKKEERSEEEVDEGNTHDVCRYESGGAEGCGGGS